jgi:hypothetical protein
MTNLFANLSIMAAPGENVSMMSVMIANVKRHYNITFSVAEFKEAFVTMRRVS